MNATDFFQTLDSLGFQTSLVLLSFLWQSSILFAAVLLISRFIQKKRASVRHLLWVSVLLIVPAIPVLTWIVSSLGTPHVVIPVMPEYSVSKVEIALPLSKPNIPETSAKPLEIPDIKTPHTVVLNDDQESPPVSSVPAQAEEAETRFLLFSYYWAFVIIVYVTGAIFYLLKILTGWICIHRRVQNSSAVIEKNVLEAFREAAHRVGLSKDYIIVESKDTVAPMTIGFFHPVVLFPSEFISNCSTHELQAVAIHELAHIKRHDSLILTFISLIRAMLFFHPLVWYSARQVSLLAEYACDDAVLETIGEPLSYAKILSRMVESLPKGTLQKEMAVGFLFSKSIFFRRIETILSNRRDRIHRLSRLALAGTVLIAVLSFIAALSLPLGYARETRKPITIYGKVLYKGKPVPGADIYFNEIKRKHIEKVAKSDRKGEFTFKMSETRLAYDQWTKPAIIAHCPGHALGYNQLSSSIPLENFVITLSDPISFTGKVTDSSGNPVEDAEISVNLFGTYSIGSKKMYFKNNILPPLKTRTDKTGTFILNDLPDAHYGFLTIKKMGYAAERKVIMQMRGNDELFTMKPEGHIKGRITFGDTGEPAKNVMIGAEQEGLRYMELEAETDSEGYYEFKNVPAGNFTIFILYDEKFPEWTMMNKENVIVKKGETVQGVDLTLIKGGIITGKVVDKDTGKPIPNHVIGFTDKRKSSIFSQHYVQTDLYGTFKFRTAPGTLKLSTSRPDGYLQQEGWDEGRIGGDHRVFVDVEAVDGQMVTVSDLAFKKGLVLHGKVSNAQGKPVSGVTITYGDALNPVEAMSDKNGAYIFTGLKPGEKLVLKAIHTGLKLRGKREVEIPADAKTDVILEKNKAEVIPDINADIQLEPFETTSVGGLLVDDRGNPITGGRIYLFPHENFDAPTMVSSSAFTDETGSYLFDGLIVGDKYSISAVRSKGYYSDRRLNMEDIFTVEEDMDPHKDLVLFTRGDRWLKGRIVDSEDSPVVGAIVSLSNDDYTVTDTDGKYRLENLTGIVIYSLNISQKDFDRYEFKYIQTNREQNFTLARGEYFLAGTVVDSNGNSIEDAYISVYPRLHMSGKRSPSIRTASDGTFRLENQFDEFITFRVYTKKSYQKFMDVQTGRDDMLLVLDNPVQRNTVNTGFFEEFEKVIKDKPAPELDVDRWMNGEPVRLADLRGKVVILDFFSERYKNDQANEILRFFQVLQEEYGDEGLVCIGIYEHMEETETLEKLIREKDLTYSIAVDKKSIISGSSGITSDAYRMKPRTPLCIVIDKNGIVRPRVDYLFLESTIKELMKEGN